jgi:hypothetical protein
MPRNVAPPGIMVVTTTPLTNLRVVFLSAFPFVMTFACLVIKHVIVPFPLEIMFEFLATKFLECSDYCSELQAQVMCLRGTIDDSLLRVHYIFLLGLSRMSS